VKQHARAARRQIEAALDHAACGRTWPWSSRLSAWLDALVMLEEEAG
jgi:hypothetical protein